MSGRSGAGIRPVPRRAGAGYPLSHGQEELWFVQRLAPESGAYNVPIAWRLVGDLDVEAAGRALQALVDRHEPLRTRFDEVDGVPVQVPSPPRPVTLAVTGIAGERELAAAIRERFDRPFDLAAPPELRPTLYVLGGDERLLLLDLHHIVTDQWSEEILWRDFAALYGHAPLPDLRVQYVDFAVWQRQRLAGPLGDRLADYWRRRLRGMATLDLPTDRPRPRTQTFRGSALAVPLAAGVQGAVGALCRKAGVTPFMCYLAVFAVLLARWSGQEDIAVGTITSGRTHPDLRDLVGFFVNTVVLRLDLGSRRTFAELLRHVREVTIGAYAHEALPFPKVVEVAARKREAGRPPLFQVLFTYVQDLGAPARLPGVRMSRAEPDVQAAKFDLVLNIAVDGPEASAVYEFNTDLFDRATITAAAAAFDELLTGLLAAPEAAAARLPGRLPHARCRDTR